MRALLLSYTSCTSLLYGRNANQFCWKAHARTTRNRQILRLRPRGIESNIFGDIASNTFMKGYFQKLSDKTEEQYFTFLGA